MGTYLRSDIFPIRYCSGEVDLEIWLFESLSGAVALETCLGRKRIHPNEIILNSPVIRVRIGRGKYFLFKAFSGGVLLEMGLFREQWFLKYVSGGDNV